MTTLYRIDLELEDLGEYDGTFLAELAAAVSKIVGTTGAVGFALTATRARADEERRP